MKLEVQDLRVGNYLNVGFKTDKKRKFLKISASDILDFSANKELSVFEYLPIRFSKEILEQIPEFVFDDMLDTNDENSWFNLRYKLLRFSADESSSFKSVFVTTQGFRMEIKYLHEFQNIFRDLTRTELFINSNFTSSLAK